MLRNSQVNLNGSAVSDPTLVADDYPSAPFVWLYSILNFLELSYVVLQGTSNPFKSRQKNMYKIIHTYLLFRVRVIFYVKKKITEQPKKTWKHLCRTVSTYLSMCILNFIYVHIDPRIFEKLFISEHLVGFLKTLSLTFLIIKNLNKYHRENARKKIFLLF